MNPISPMFRTASGQLVLPTPRPRRETFSGPIPTLGPTHPNPISLRPPPTRIQQHSSINEHFVTWRRDGFPTRLRTTWTRRFWKCWWSSRQ
ncbi:hypothetical protein BC830DRAFT_1145826 [Chytriomyces sp. MP71]|nr:hypothetical protein BC830DRAFT_1145826 [Chytriomyces sp. MP71]